MLFPAHLPVPSTPPTRLHFQPMSNPMQPNVKLINDPNYRENYANSVQMRVNIWDFFLIFGTLLQQTESNVEIKNFQGIYLSPQQAKALLGLLQQNVAGYESAFGEIKLDPRMAPPGPVH
jgi:flagellar protein FlaG